MITKTPCPVTRPEFRANAKPVSIQIGDSPLLASVKEFQTGSMGWYTNGKVMLPVNGQMVSVQVGVTLTIVNSKEVPQ